MESKNADILEPQPLDDWFLELLACPGCEQHLPVHLNEAKDQLLCKCGRYAFPLQDGLPNLLIEEAVVLDENARPEDVAPGT